MNKGKWILQHTGYPVAGRPIYEKEWKNLSYHASLNAVVRRYGKEIAHLDFNSWDDHYRAIDPDGNVRDIYGMICILVEERTERENW